MGKEESERYEILITLVETVPGPFSKATSPSVNADTHHRTLSNTQ